MLREQLNPHSQLSPIYCPNGQAALRSGPVAERVVKLRELARENPEDAREQAWQWIEDLGTRATNDRDGALVERSLRPFSQKSALFRVRSVPS